MDLLPFVRPSRPAAIRQTQASVSVRDRAMRIALAVAIVVATSWSAGGGVAAAGRLPGFGSQFHAMWSDYTRAERLEVLDKLEAAGARWVRIDFGWSSLQPTGPREHREWYVDLADKVVDAARRRGIRVLMTLWRTPGWANGDAGENVPPDDPADYARAAKWIARHFRGRVAAWEVWNEPNLAGGGFWTGTPQDYAELLEASYGSFKAGDPRAKVVAGSVVYNDVDWLRAMYEAGAGGSFDVISTHPYQGVANEPPDAPDDGTKWRLSHVGAVHALMRSFGDGGKPIWFTEFGWSSHPNDGDEENWELGVSLRRQARYAVRAFRYVAGRFPYVPVMIWYNERNRTTGAPQLDNYGLLERDLTPKPVYRALADLFGN
jgi:hypothetical protein